MATALEVCIRYEKARKEIVRLTQKIGEAAEVKCERDSEKVSLRNIGKSGPACIERLWIWNKQARLAEQEYGYYPDDEQPKLCPRCAQIDRLIQHRKKAKQEFGIEKRAVSAVGKSAAIQQIN